MAVTKCRVKSSEASDKTVMRRTLKSQRQAKDDRRVFFKETSEDLRSFADGRGTVLLMLVFLISCQLNYSTEEYMDESKVRISCINFILLHLKP